MAMIREISGRLYSVVKQRGKQHSQPLAEAIADNRERTRAATDQRQQAVAAVEGIDKRLGTALAAGDWEQARTVQQELGAARQTLQEVDAELGNLVEHLADYQRAATDQRIRQQQARFTAELNEMLARHPIPEHPEAA